MNPKRKLARLTTSGAWFDLAVPGGSAPERAMIPASEIAAALGMGDLPRPAYLLGLAVWASDNAAARQLPMALVPAMEYHLAAAGEPGHGVHALCELAVLEVLWPRRCPECLGEGRLRLSCCRLRDHAHIDCTQTCDLCAGRGRVAFTVREAARVIGVSRSTFHRVWSRRAAIVRRELATIEEQLLAHVRDQLLDEYAGLEPDREAI